MCVTLACLLACTCVQVYMCMPTYLRWPQVDIKYLSCSFPTLCWQNLPPTND